jgi:LexA-binding, inner membrane-associated putative hydrolase
MSSYKGHLLGGCAVYLCIIMSAALCSVIETESLFRWMRWLCCTLIGALFPDLDTKSIGQKWFYRALLVASIMLIVYDQQKIFTIVSLGSLIPLLVNHRGLLHRWWFILGVAGVYVVAVTSLAPVQSDIALYDACFFLAGAASHLWLDGGFRLLLRVR